MALLTNMITNIPASMRVPTMTSPPISENSNNASMDSIDPHYLKPCDERLKDDDSCHSDDTVLSVGNEDPRRNLIMPAQLSFKNIQNHLNAISAITNNINKFNHQRMMMGVSPAPSLSPAYPSTSSPSMERLTPNSSASSGPNSPASPKFDAFSKNNDEHLDNANINLKFSIDNILKADFGRRITDPLTIKKSLSSRHKKRALSKDSYTASVLAAAAIAVDPKVDECKSRAVQSAASPVDLSKDNALSCNSSEISEPPGSGESVKGEGTTTTTTGKNGQPMLWPAWVYCTRYSDRPSSGPRARRNKVKSPTGNASSNDEKRPRTAFSGAQLARLKHEFAENRYLTERRRQQLSGELGLNEAQIKIWFQNKRAKIKKASGQKNPLALQLMAQGLYNHSTVPLTREEEEQAQAMQE